MGTNDGASEGAVGVGERSVTEIAGGSLAIMMAGMFWPFAFGVLAAVILEEFQLTPSAFGIAYAVYYLSASLGSPLVGRMVDRLEHRHTVRVMMLGSLGQIALFASSTSLVGLLASAVVGGVVMAATNPLTNALIHGTLQGRGMRLAVGFKMGGVPLAAVMSGVVLPPIAEATSWRVAILSLALLPVMVLLASPRLNGIERVRRGDDASPASRGRWTGLETFALFLGVVTAGVNGYLPLYVVDELEGSLSRGGALLAAFALAGALARFGWSVVLQSGYQVHLAMVLLPTVGAAALLGLGLARSGGVLWVVVIASGITLMGWQGVAMLAIIDGSQGSVGRDSARVFQWFYAGFVLGAPAAGWLVERANYLSMWVTLAGAAGVAALSIVPQLLRLRAREAGRVEG